MHYCPRIFQFTYFFVTGEPGLHCFCKDELLYYIRMGALIDKTTFEGGAYSKRSGAYWKEGAKSNSHGFGGLLDG